MAVASEEILADHAKCIKQHALNVGKNAKFHSSRKKASLCFAKNAIERRDNSNSFRHSAIMFERIFLFF